MTPRRARRLAVILGIAATALPGAAAAQSFIPQPQTYLLSTDPVDGRALWVQPAAMVRRREASVAAMFTASQGGGKTSVSQYGLTLASGVLGLGWQHDKTLVGATNNTFTAGLSGGTPEASVGFDRRWYSGTGLGGLHSHDGSWDIGARGIVLGAIEASIVWRDISSPVVLGDTLRSTIVPGAAMTLLHGKVRVGADWELLQHGWTTSAVRVGATAPLPMHLQLTVRGETNGQLSARSLSVALSWGSPTARATGFREQTRSPDVDRTGAWVSAVTDPNRRRFGR